MKAPGPVAVAAVGAGDPRRQPLAGDVGDAARGEVEHDASAPSSSSSESTRRAGLDPAAVLAQHRGQRVGDRPRAAPRHRPAEAWQAADQRHPDRRAHRPVERAEGVRGDAAEQRPRLRRAPARASTRRRRRGRQAEARQPQRVPGHVQDRPADVLGERVEGARRASRRRRATPARPARAPRRSPRSSAASRRRCRRRAGGPGRPPASATRARAAPGRASSGTGEPTAIGWTAEQSSCSSPGTVSSLRAGAAADRRRRPRARSPRRPRAPARPRRPARSGPEPTTMASLTRVGAARLPGRAGPAGRPRPGIPRLVEPGLARDHVGDVDLSPPRPGPVGGVVDPVALALRRAPAGTPA